MSEFEEKNTSDIIVNSVEEIYAVIDKYNQEFHFELKWNIEYINCSRINLVTD